MFFSQLVKIVVLVGPQSSVVDFFMVKIPKVDGPRICFFYN